MTTLKDIFIKLFIVYFLMNYYFMFSALCTSWSADHHLFIKLSFLFISCTVQTLFQKYTNSIVNTMI